jgi:hypothetical protein
MCLKQGLLGTGQAAQIGLYGVAAAHVNSCCKQDLTLLLSRMRPSTGLCAEESAVHGQHATHNRMQQPVMDDACKQPQCKPKSQPRSV